MTWLIILIAIVVVVYIIATMNGSSREDAAGAAAGAGMYAGGCMLQVFFGVIGIMFMLWLFGFLFG